MQQESIFQSSLLGPIREPAVTVVIDTSASMYEHLDTVQHGISLWLRTIAKAPYSPPKINLFSLSTDQHRWRETVTQLNPTNLDSALQWLCQLQCSGGECCLVGGLHAILSDIASQAVYFITDGYPNTGDGSQSDRLAKLLDRNPSFQPIHVVVVGSESKHGTGEQKWLENINSRQAADPTQAPNRQLLINIAKRTLGTVRHVKLPSNNTQVQVPHARVVANFHPGSFVTTKYTGVSNTHSGPPLGHNPDFGHTPQPGNAAASMIDSVYQDIPASFGHSTPLTHTASGTQSLLERHNPGLSLRPVETLLGRFVVADYMRGILVLALCYDQGVYRPGKILEQVDEDQFLIEFNKHGAAESGASGPRDTQRYLCPQKTHLTDFLALLDALEQPFDVTDRVLALRRDVNGADVYIPATVMKLAELTLGGLHETKVLVAFHDGQLESLLQHQAVKISASRYVKAVQSITSKHGDWTSSAYSPLFTHTLQMPTQSRQLNGSDAQRQVAAAQPSMLAAHNQAAAPSSGYEQVYSDLTSPNGVGLNGHGDMPMPEEYGFARDTDDQSRAISNSSSMVTSSTASLKGLAGGNMAEPAGAKVDMWWPKEPNPAGRVMNVSSDFQSGFEAGFASAQQTVQDVHHQETYEKPSADAALQSYRQHVQAKRANATYQQSNQWQYHRKVPVDRHDNRSSGRETILQVPRQAIVNLSLQSRPWTAPSRPSRLAESCQDDAFLPTGHLKRHGTAHGTTISTANNTWESGNERITARQKREECRDAIRTARQWQEETAKSRNMLAAQQRREARRKKEEDIQLGDEKQNYRRTRAPVAVASLDTEEERFAKQAGRFNSMQDKVQRRQQELQESRQNEALREDTRQGLRASRNNSRTASLQRKVAAEETKAHQRRQHKDSTAAARRSKDMAERSASQQRDDLESFLDARKSQHQRNKSFQ